MGSERFASITPGVPQAVADGLRYTLDLILAINPTAKITPIGPAPGGVPSKVRVYVPPTRGYFGGRTYTMNVREKQQNL